MSAHPLSLRLDVTITALEPKHAPAMYRWMCDPAVREGIGLRVSPTLERTQQWIAKALGDPAIRPFAVLCEGQHVGNVVLDRLDRYLGTARLSVYIGEPARRGRGVGRTAVYRALGEGFAGLDLHKIWLTVHARNAEAIRTYACLGFALEGILRDEFLLAGERLPAFYMGLLREDFERIPVQWSAAPEPS